MDELPDLLEANPELLEFHADTAVGILGVATGKAPCYANSKRIIGGRKVVVVAIEINQPPFSESAYKKDIEDLVPALQRAAKAAAKAAKGS